MPLTNKTRTRLQAEARRGANPTRCPQDFRDRLQLATGRFAEPTVFDFLQAIADPADQQVSTNPWWFAVVKPPPFVPKILDTGAVPTNL